MYTSDIVDLIEVDNSSPTGAIWAKDFKRHKKGDVFGYLSHTKKYWRQKINKKQYAVHTLIWLKVNKTLGENNTVDHIDRNGLNNKITNLREASCLEQLHNRKAWSSSSYRGVSKVKGYDNYSAYVMYPKYGRIHLGYYKIAEHAAIAHDIAALILFKKSDFYALNFNHGFWLSHSTHISEKVLEKINTFLKHC